MGVYFRNTFLVVRLVVLAPVGKFPFGPEAVLSNFVRP